MRNTLARCERTNKYEEWNSYIKEEKGIRVNKILVFWTKRDVKLVLLSCQDCDLKDNNYLNEVMQLVHDLPVQFEFIREFVEYEEELEARILQFKEKYL